ncbi:hypothetical protein AURANDRAFT_66052 [Aureococcus anophagefferens]|uniref:Uncharacterized protein n=1 Tax=Aureococcus anophagefferens TaxID=44056 RepID=F0YG51_AURAN|nr:hypothetical protein AURANDRAFT_66052 [Aureococcus anophagefferens]EGB05939.1 hypothetical protein AURANDRAFT_66052 [Aureococcus anophagefferens]|eukprot:XP_009039479.1 hypothetical protein AURANDRAFT_66052 [Aureococcus anophagefferens]
MSDRAIIRLHKRIVFRVNAFAILEQQYQEAQSRDEAQISFTAECPLYGGYKNSEVLAVVRVLLQGEWCMQYTLSYGVEYAGRKMSVYSNTGYHFGDAAEITFWSDVTQQTLRFESESARMVELLVRVGRDLSATDELLREAYKRLPDTGVNVYKRSNANFAHASVEPFLVQYPLIEPPSADDSEGASMRTLFGEPESDSSDDVPIALALTLHRQPRLPRGVAPRDEEQEEDDEDDGHVAARTRSKTPEKKQLASMADKKRAVSTSDDAGSAAECPLTIGMDCVNCEQSGTSLRCITCLMAVCSLCCAAGECINCRDGDKAAAYLSWPYNINLLVAKGIIMNQVRMDANVGAALQHLCETATGFRLCDLSADALTIEIAAGAIMDLERFIRGDGVLTSFWISKFRNYRPTVGSINLGATNEAILIFSDENCIAFCLALCRLVQRGQQFITTQINECLAKAWLLKDNAGAGDSSRVEDHLKFCLAQQQSMIDALNAKAATDAAAKAAAGGSGVAGRGGDSLRPGALGAAARAQSGAPGDPFATLSAAPRAPYVGTHPLRKATPRKAATGAKPADGAPKAKNRPTMAEVPKATRPVSRSTWSSSNPAKATAASASRFVTMPPRSQKKGPGGGSAKPRSKKPRVDYEAIAKAAAAAAVREARRAHQATEEDDDASFESEELCESSSSSSWDGEDE